MDRKRSVGGHPTGQVERSIGRVELVAAPVLVEPTGDERVKAGAPRQRVRCQAGAFVRQYRATGDAFAGLQDISLDLTSNTLYVVTADRLYSFKVN